LQDKLTLLQPRQIPATGKTDAELSPLELAQLEGQEKTRKLYREVTSELAKIEKDKAKDPMDAMDAFVKLRNKVNAAKIDESAKQSLAIIVDLAVSEHQKFVDANSADIALDLQNEAVKREMELENSREAEIDQEISSLVEQYNKLMEERRFPEAELIARQVQALKPNETIGIMMSHNSRTGTRLAMAEDTKAAKADSFMDNLHSLDEAMVGMNPNMTVQMPDAQRWTELSRIRAEDDSDDRSMSPAEREINRKLFDQVNVKYKNRPLGEVLEDLSAITGVSIVLDEPALSAVRVTSETPVSLQLNEPVMLKSALSLILERLELAYVIRHDVLMITSVEAKRSNVINRVYRVADLVTPIPNFASSYEDGLAGALRAAYQMTQPQADVQMVPVSMTDLAGGMAKTMSPAMNNSSVLGQYHPMGSQGGFGVNNPPGGGGGAGGAAFADFDSLMQLIQTTIEPDSWEELGGSGTMMEYPQNLSLVISTTSDVHDQILDLLESLRRLQNLQITIEVRFITLSDQFSESIGVDFDVQFDDNLNSFPTDDAGPRVSVGVNANGTLTDDLDIQVNNNLAVTAPFAAGVPTPTTLGFAILSDIEAYFFLQATQADSRSNVMQAPKVTLFDGQLATISDQTQRPFVTSITPVVGDFAVAQQPVIVVLNEGTQLNVQGIVSDDKRYVRLTLVPFFSQIGDVDTFTYEGRRTTRRGSSVRQDTNGDGKVDEKDIREDEEESDVVEGTTVQLPSFAFTTVSTTVSVPDGGTILLGGIKRLSEGRSEAGVPILSKIPYISRLFRNQAIGRDARSLMLMVTPRIIIQEEEELAQTGFLPNQ
jgi:general secretion pathway protein D